MSNYIDIGGRCKKAVYLRNHRVIDMNELGYRCKYCGKTLFELRSAQKEKERRKRL